MGTDDTAGVQRCGAGERGGWAEKHLKVDGTKAVWDGPIRCNSHVARKLDVAGAWQKRDEPHSMRPEEGEL